MKWPLVKALFFLLSHVLCSLLFLLCYVLAHWSYACVCMCTATERERETERKRRAANGRRRSEGQAKTSARKKWKGQDTTRIERTRKKSITIKRTIIWRFTVGRRSDVGWWWWRRSLLFFLSFIAFLSLSFALHATSGLSTHTVLLIALVADVPIFSLCFLFSLCYKKKTNNYDSCVFFHL